MAKNEQDIADKLEQHPVYYGNNMELKLKVAEMLDRIAKSDDFDVVNANFLMVITTIMGNMIGWYSEDGEEYDRMDWAFDGLKETVKTKVDEIIQVKKNMQK